MRVLHFSDVHIGIGWRHVPWRKWLGKRGVGGLNLVMGRARYFADAREKIAMLARFKAEHGVDLVVFSGDYTALGLERELVAARESIEPFLDAPAGFVNVPGNHDIYVPDVVRGRLFEKHFRDTLASDLPEAAVDGAWPLVRFVDDRVAVLAVNSARPNALLWRSSGKIPERQLAALGELLCDPRIRERFVFVVTHYTPRLADGRPDTGLHGMVNAEEFLSVCADLPRGAILCGHVHHRFQTRADGARPPIFCAGSATMAGREGFWLYDVDKEEFRARRGGWDGARYVLSD